MTSAVETPVRLEDLAYERDILREEKRSLESRVKDINGLLETNEIAILEKAEELGVDSFAVGPISFSVSRNVVGNVQDWDTVWDYIITNNATHLVQRRLANAAYKELLDMDETLPGVEPFTKVSLNMRKKS